MSEQLVTVGDQNILLETEEGEVVADVFIVARIVSIHDRDERIAIMGGDSTSTLTGLALLRVAARDVEDTVLGDLYRSEDDE